MSILKVVKNKNKSYHGSMNHSGELCSVTV